MGSHSAPTGKHAVIVPSPVVRAPAPRLAPRPVVRAPAPHVREVRKKKSNLIWWVVAAVLFAAVGVVAWLSWRAAQNADAEIEVATMISVEKQLAGSGSDTYTTDAAGTCFGIGKYADLHEGTVVRIYGDVHQLLGMTKLSAGVNDTENNTCVWSASDMVRGSEDFYAVQVKSFDEVTGNASDVVDGRLTIAQIVVQ